MLSNFPGVYLSMILDLFWAIDCDGSDSLPDGALTFERNDTFYFLLLETEQSMRKLSNSMQRPMRRRISPPTEEQAPNFLCCESTVLAMNSPADITWNRDKLFLSNHTQITKSWTNKWLLLFQALTISFVWLSSHG